jgi:hypothetical protein
MKEEELPIGVPTLQPGDIVLATSTGQIPVLPLATYEERSRTVLVFNDAVSESTGELDYLDYLQGTSTRRPGHFLRRHGFVDLAASETSAAPSLRAPPGAVVMNNLPRPRSAHVARPALEADLYKYLMDDRRRIVSLDGRGGVGKTYLAIEVCQRIAADKAAESRFGAVVWVSGRDIDLTAAGPVPVRQDVVTLDDVLGFVVRACGVATQASTAGGQKLRESFVDVCKHLNLLIVLDNFETYAEPEKMFTDLDDLVPNGTKVLITSRHRDYRGDFPVTVGRMSEDESRELILNEARARYVAPKFESSDRVKRVYETAQGHAYTMRLIVAQVGKGMDVHNACTEVEKSSDVLKALFERSLRNAQPTHVDLVAVLAAVRLECPLEAMLLLPLPRADIEDAVGHLHNLSLLERIDEPLLHEKQYLCPRATGEYIRDTRLLDSPEARARIEGFAANLRAHVQLMRVLAKKRGVGPMNAEVAADVMLEVARKALDQKGNDVARRAVEIALSLSGEDATIVREAATILQRAGSAPEQVDGLFKRLLGLDPTNAEAWLEWGRTKAAQPRTRHGEVMTCFERAFEADSKSRPAVIAFVGSVLEVCKQEKKIGAGAVRLPSDRRPARTLLVNAREALDQHIAMHGGEGDRARLLGLKGWVLLNLEGPSARVHEIVREARSLAPKSEPIEKLVQAVARIEAEKRAGGGGGKGSR